MNISESLILQLHRDMLKYSETDQRHRGHYKFGSNRVEAKDVNGDLVGVIFDPTPPHLVAKEMQELVEWYALALETTYKHPLILMANFIFEYLAIHPFQDGNGRTSRLLTNLMLMRDGYLFTSIASHEKYIENNKLDYYESLNKTQLSWKTESEDVSKWILFFLNTILAQSEEALAILKGNSVDYLLSENQLAILAWMRTSAKETVTRKDLIEALNIPARTVEAAIKRLFDMKQIERLGSGRATRYKSRSPSPTGAHNQCLNTVLLERRWCARRDSNPGPTD
jgi:Fic family protein